MTKRNFSDIVVKTQRFYIADILFLQADCVQWRNRVFFMEDGSRLPLAGCVILLLLLWLNGIFYGFSAAVHNLSGSEVEKRAQE